MEENGTLDRVEKIEGVILIDKPRGMTSHDVVDRVRKVAGTRRVGHAGTLDPMAEGLLVVCVGPATRIAQFLTGLTKEYTGVIKLGAFSSTYDAEGSIMAQSASLPREPEVIGEAMRHQTGWQTQLPPPYSAIKVRGKKLYEYARRGEEVPEKPRRVRIHHFEMIEYCEPEIRFRTKVGSGTYVRSMAHDLGVQLQCGAYLAELRRERVGHFHVGEAVELATLIENPTLISERILGLAESLAHLPRITVSATAERDVLNGKGFTIRDIVSCEALPRPSENSVVLNSKGKVLSVARGELIADLEREMEGVPEIPSGEETDRGRQLYFRPVRVLGRDEPHD